MYTLVYQNKKNYQGGGGPLCPMRWLPFRANLFFFFLQLKSGILETLSESVICIYIACT